MRANINLHNMDCMVAMKDMKDNQFDLAIVDPPYGNTDAIGIKNGNSHVAKRKDYDLFENTAPEIIYFEELKRVSKNQIIWGGNYFGLRGGYICWNKFGTAFGEAELAYCSSINSVRVFEYIWNGMIQDNMKNKEKRIHPTQKPKALYKWILENFAKQGDSILDTHAGSLSIALACWDMRFDLEAYEIDKNYYDMACKRFAQHCQQGQFF
jgi:site-specific DNA-methyltransferase (adenine-specific)